MQVELKSGDFTVKVVQLFVGLLSPSGRMGRSILPLLLTYMPLDPMALKNGVLILVIAYGSRDLQ